RRAVPRPAADHSPALPRTAGSPRRQDLGLDGDRVSVAAAFDDADQALQVARAGHEGVVAKTHDGRYLPGRRSPSWRKHVFVSTCSAQIVGYRPANGSRAATIG